jgi:acyl-[acyl carrier protein]--UDP-N-acetylglucosamine O-acyltransferase
MSSKPVLVILGDRTAQEILEAAQLAYGDQFSQIVKCYFEPKKFFAEDSVRIAARSDSIFFHVGVATDGLKQTMVRACEDVGWSPWSVIHPTAVISPSARVGVGVFVGPLAVVSSEAVIGDHSIVHIHASIGHNSSIGSYTAILPGARISGNVVVGERALIGSNAFIAAGKTIGSYCRVDALAYVHQDISEGFIVSPRHPKPLRRVDLRTESPRKP